MIILMLTIGFRPNIGGIETHFDDFLKVVSKYKINVTVVTYQPITSNSKGKVIEEFGKHKIIRIPWPKNFFYKLVDKPILEFLYLFPGIFLGGLILIMLNYSKIKLIHSHGLIAGTAAVLLGKIFSKKIIISTHSIYNFPENSLYKWFAKWIFMNADHNLCLSQQSVQELINLGIPTKKVSKFTYWINLQKFRNLSIKHKINSSLNVLFVGRLVKEKGVLQLLKSIEKFDKQITLSIAGDGPFRKNVDTAASKFPTKLKYLGKIANEKLPQIYNSADLIVVPSINEEGFGRVILEALACGKPVLASKKGGIPEAMNETVGEFIEPNPKAISSRINYLAKHRHILQKYSANARKYATDKYSEKNILQIIKYYGL